MENKHEMFIKNKKITEHSVRLLGIEIDNQLHFDNLVSTQHYAKKQVEYIQKRALRLQSNLHNLIYTS